MLVYRIAQTRYANDLSGEGARLFGGRWNLPMTPCLYASESRALSLLEYSVNVNANEICRALSFVTLKIDNARIHEVMIHELPGNWMEPVIPQHTREFGTRLLIEQKLQVIKIPSVVIADEFNYLINPLHCSDLKIVAIKDYPYDIRIKLK